MGHNGQVIFTMCCDHYIAIIRGLGKVSQLDTNNTI